ncbi:MAG: hypothetical protein JNM53_05280, partial [Gemmatimonadetes bacterium]|nr:hypothetical protein [Gemmatimonadota bacterium]
RARRGIDILKQIAQDIDTEGNRGLHPEHVEMQLLMQQLVERIGHLRTRSSG